MMSSCCRDKSLVKTSDDIVLIVVIVRLSEIGIIIVCTVNHWVLNAYRSCCSYRVCAYTRPSWYVSMIVLIAIDFIVILRDHLVELVGVELF
jgi:hypothetical protein